MREQQRGQAVDGARLIGPLDGLDFGL